MHAISSLEFRNFGISLGSRAVLMDTSLSLPSVGVEVLVGPSGSDKSLLLSSLAGLHSSSPSFKHWGEILISGKRVDINDQDSSSRPVLVRSTISELNQTVESLILSNYKTVKAHSISRQEFLNNLLIDYELEELLPLLKHRVIDIQLVWQRIVFTLIAAAKKPPLLMLDEPTKGLKYEEAVLMMRFIRHLGKQLKIVLTLGSLAEAREVADHIVLLAGGRVRFHGENDVFFAKTSPSDIVKEFVQTGNVSTTEFDTSSNSLMEKGTAPQYSQSTIGNNKPNSSKKENSKLTDHLEAYPIAERNFINEQDKKPVTKSSEKSDTETHKELIPSIHPETLLKPSKEGAYLVAEVGMHKSNNLQAAEGFFWIVSGVLAACPMPGAHESMGHDLGLLASLGITKLITLCEEDLYQAELEAAGLSNEHLPMPNSGIPSLTQMHMLLLRMQKHIESLEVLAVHCLNGLGNTGTVLAAWMIKEGRISAAEAIEKLRKINPDFIQNAAQEAFLMQFENDALRRLKE